MNIILTSSGFEYEEVINKVKSKIQKEFYDLKMLVIPTARKNEYNEEKYILDYVNLGFKKNNIIMFNDETADKYKNLDIDIIYVCGGNTFLLQKTLLESGFDSEIKRYIKDRCYIFRS
ncbi:MAG: Type 1 glutamine amidotransferase-like domain-containing protein [Clostridia bacterium]|nr:Type 1 glutamine amidotransferase-like domain-containing protein [Clostridia bacterium]